MGQIIEFPDDKKVRERIKELKKLWKILFLKGIILNL